MNSYESHFLDQIRSQSRKYILHSMIFGVFINVTVSYIKCFFLDIYIYIYIYITQKSRRYTCIYIFESRMNHVCCTAIQREKRNHILKKNEKKLKVYKFIIKISYMCLLISLIK
jgi:hypothetical protein